MAADDTAEGLAVMRIVSVRATPIGWTKQLEESWLNETVIANPMSTYPRHHDRRSSWGPRWKSEVVVEIVTDEGIIGLGGSAPLPAKEIIDGHLAHLLMGEDPFNVEMLWDQMWRSTLPYGRKGIAVMALSALDIALWDIIAKARDEPLYRTLGGKTKETIACYATGNDVSVHARLGFSGFKLAMPFGPADGWWGMKGNIERVEEVRDKGGPDIEIMLDCYMAWDVPYTLKIARLLESYRIAWLEECLPPDDYEGYAEITAKIGSTSIATGEHEYSRWGFKELLTRRACHVLQPDLSWCGGITEAKKIAAMASAFGIDVVPHAGGLQPWTIHFIAATVNAPLAELVVIGGALDADPLLSLYPYLEGWDRPVDGRLTPSDRPGIGIDRKIETESSSG